MALTADPPDLTALKELPEITRDAIERGLGEVQLPERATLVRAGRAVSDLDVSRAVSGAVTGAATAVGLISPSRRRWPYVLAGAIAIAAASWVAIERDTLRMRLDDARRSVRAWWIPSDDADRAVAFTAAETKPIEPSMAADGTGSDYPEGLGDGDAATPEPALEATR